jgi:hypothetical protein
VVNPALAATAWNSADDEITPRAWSTSPTWAGDHPCWTSTGTSALPAVELSTLLSTHSDAMASGVSMAATTIIVMRLRR